VANFEFVMINWISIPFRTATWNKRAAEVAVARIYVWIFISKGLKLRTRRYLSRKIVVGQA
jgi:hypothetical protein